MDWVRAGLGACLGGSGVGEHMPGPQNTGRFLLVSQNLPKGVALGWQYHPQPNLFHAGLLRLLDVLGTRE